MKGQYGQSLRQKSCVRAWREHAQWASSQRRPRLRMNSANAAAAPGSWTHCSVLHTVAGHAARCLLQATTGHHSGLVQSHLIVILTSVWNRVEDGLLMSLHNNVYIYRSCVTLYKKLYWGTLLIIPLIGNKHMRFDQMNRISKSKASTLKKKKVCQGNFSLCSNVSFSAVPPLTSSLTASGHVTDPHPPPRLAPFFPWCMPASIQQNWLHSLLSDH